MIWIFIALLGAFFTSMTTITAKVGIKNVNSNFATTYRTGIVIICALLMCLISGNITKINQITFDNAIFLGLSGIATGCSWLCYYKALKLGNINKVAPIDKSSFILTSILFLIFFFNDTTKNGNVLTIVMLFVSMVLMLVGTMMMISKDSSQESQNKQSKKWLLFAILSAVFASLVSLFVKIGLKNIPSDLGTFIRTIVVFVFALAIVLAKKDYVGIKEISKKSWLFLTISGIMTGGAWLCEYEALNFIGSNPVVVNSISKLAILLTMLLSYILLKEKFTKKSILGLLIMTLGIVLIIIFSL
ncbi:MAG: EamA family transporter [Bacilli bacterium]